MVNYTVEVIVDAVTLSNVVHIIHGNNDTQINTYQHE